MIDFHYIIMSHFCVPPFAQAHQYMYNLQGFVAEEGSSSERKYLGARSIVFEKEMS